MPLCAFYLAEEKTSEYTDTLFPGEPKQRDKCTDTEEDQLLEEPNIEYRSKITQYPSTARSIAEGKSLSGSDGASSPEGPDLVYVPAEASQLAAHVLGNSDSLYSVRDVAASVQTLYEESQTSENEFTPIERAAKDASAVPAAEASLEALRSQPGVWSQSSIAGELGPSDSQADASTNDVNQASSVPLWEKPSSSPLSPSPAPKDPLQAVPSCHEAEVTSTTEVVSLYWAKLIMDAEVPHYVEQFPEKITIPFIDQTAYMLKIEQPLDAGQGSSATTLASSVDDLVCYPERMESTAQAESAEQVYVLSGKKVCVTLLFQLPALQLHQWSLNGKAPMSMQCRVKMTSNKLLYQCCLLGPSAHVLDLCCLFQEMWLALGRSPVLLWANMQIRVMGRYPVMPSGLAQNKPYFLKQV